MVTGGILQYSKDFHSTANEDIGAKDFFAMACRIFPSTVLQTDI